MGYLDDSLKKTTSIVIILGRGCNMNCCHCTQHDLNCNFEAKNHIDALLTWLYKWILSRDENAFYLDSRKRKRICFYGGEPLMYFDKIMYICNKLGEFGITKNDVSYKVFTNGLLLNDFKLDFLKSYEFKIGLSYDSPEPLLLRSNVPDNNVIKMFNDYPFEKHVNSVYTAKYSLVDLFDGLAQIFPNTERTFGPLRDSNNISEKLSLFPVGKVKQDIYDLYLYYLKNDFPRDIGNFLKGNFAYYTNLENKKDQGDAYEDVAPYCGGISRRLSIDLLGNVFLCHCGSTVIGNVLKDDICDINAKSYAILNQNRSFECRQCKWLSVCASGCLEYKTNQDTHKITQCVYFKEVNEARYELIFGHC